MSKNAEGWIRHRGSKCPVEKGTLIDVRFRNGDIVDGVKALERHGGEHVYGWCAGVEFWKKDDVSADIMAYRLHKPAEQVEACSKPELQINLPDNYRETIGCSVEGPLQWRDRIAEIDVATQALTTERDELVQKLASEGFALIGRAVEQVEDMSDWRNWKVGDLVERVKDGEESGMQLNTPLKITSFDWDDNRGQSVEVDSSYFPFVSSLKWHSRPSA